MSWVALSSHKCVSAKVAAFMCAQLKKNVVGMAVFISWAWPWSISLTLTSPGLELVTGTSNFRQAQFPGRRSNGFGGQHWTLCQELTPLTAPKEVFKQRDPRRRTLLVVPK
jgi:hypothetical protein